MEATIRRLGTINLRRIDVRDWDSAVANQHGIRSLPTLALYDGDELVSDDKREILDMISGR